MLNLSSLRAKRPQKLKDFVLSRGQTEHLIRHRETPWGPAKLSGFRVNQDKQLNLSEPQSFLPLIWLIKRLLMEVLENSMNS